MTLAELVKNQKNSEFYEKTLRQVNTKINILGKRKHPEDKKQEENGMVENLRGLLQEEEKDDGQAQLVKKLSQFNHKEPQDIEEEKELVELYGPKIKVIRWYFENHKEIMKIKGYKKNNKSK